MHDPAAARDFHAASYRIAQLHDQVDEVANVSARQRELQRADPDGDRRWCLRDAGYSRPGPGPRVRSNNQGVLVDRVEVVDRRRVIAGANPGAEQKYDERAKRCGGDLTPS